MDPLEVCLRITLREKATVCNSQQHNNMEGTIMKLNFNIGAVVNLHLDCQTNLVTSGKVISADEDEVVILLQELVANYDYGDNWGCNGEQLDRMHTVSVGPPLHIDRARIVAWSYYTIPTNPRATHYGIFRPADLEKMNPDSISSYENLICPGDGEPVK